MKQAWHIFKKDARHLRLEIGIVAAMSLLFAWSRIDSGSPGSSRMGIFPILLLIASMYLTARVIHEEAIPGTNQFWITRP